MTERAEISGIGLITALPRLLLQASPLAKPKVHAAKIQPFKKQRRRHVQNRALSQASAWRHRSCRTLENKNNMMNQAAIKLEDLISFAGTLSSELIFERPE